MLQLNTQFPAYDISPPMILTESADRLGEVLKVSDEIVFLETIVFSTFS